MSLLFAGKKIIPKPFVSLSRQQVKTEDGTLLGGSFQIVLKGKLVAHMGSPSAAGVFHTGAGYPADDVLTQDERLGALLKKQSALRELFSSNEGGLLEIQGWTGSSQPVKANVRFVSISFPDELWFDYSTYEVVLEADTLFGVAVEGSQAHYLNSAQEEWTLDPASDTSAGEDPVYKLTHRVSAVGKRHYDETGTLLAEAWQNASGWVIPRLGLDASQLAVPGVLDSFSAFDYSRAQSVSKYGGSFGVTETWTVSSGSLAHEEYTVNARTSEQDGLTQVSIDGTIKGFDQRNNTTYALVTTKWANAQAKWAQVEPLLHTRAEELSGLDVASSPRSTTISYNRTAGQIGYQYEFSDRPDNVFDPESISESVSVQDQNAGDVVAVLPAVARAAGPILQDTGSSTLKERTVSIQIQKPRKRQGYSPVKPNIGPHIAARYPSGYTVMYIRTDSENWEEFDGRYSRTVSIIWE